MCLMMSTTITLPVKANTVDILAKVHKMFLSRVAHINQQLDI